MGLLNGVIPVQRLSASAVRCRLRSLAAGKTDLCEETLTLGSAIGEHEPGASAGSNSDQFPRPPSRDIKHLDYSWTLSKMADLAWFWLNNTTSRSSTGVRLSPEALPAGCFLPGASWSGLSSAIVRLLVYSNLDYWRWVWVSRCPC